MSRRPGDPTESTVKTLYAHSRNLCYYTACEEKLTDPRWASVNSHIAHIRGASPGSARHDPMMSDDDRASFFNLMLLCPNHHRRIDNLEPDAEIHTVEALEEMKERAESHGPVDWATDEQFSYFARLTLELHITSTANAQTAVTGVATSAATATGVGHVEPPPPTDPRSYDRRYTPDEPAGEPVPFDAPIPFDRAPPADAAVMPRTDRAGAGQGSSARSEVVVEVPATDLRIEGVEPVVVSGDVGVMTLQGVAGLPVVGSEEPAGDTQNGPSGFVARPGGGDVPIDDVMDRLRARTTSETN